MSNHLQLLPPSLKKLLDRRQFNEAETQLGRELTSALSQYDCAYTRNKHVSELHFQYAVVAHENVQHAQALEQAIQSFHYDVFSFHQHSTLIAIALAEGSDKAQSFACEVSWWFVTAYTQVGENDPLAFWTEDDQRQAENSDLHPNRSKLNAVLELYQHFEKINTHQLEKALFFERIGLVDRGSDVDTLLALCDDYAQKGTPHEWCKMQKNVTLFNAERYDEVMTLWGSDDPNSMTDIWVYMRVLLSRIYTGKGLPETLVTVEAEQASDYYGVMTTLMDFYHRACRAIEQLDHDDDKTRLLHEKADIERLALFIGEHGLKLYRGVEQGELINGYANDAHFYAMYCRNFSNILSKTGDTSRALDITEKGFSLSPFIENGRSMIIDAIELELYDRAQTNIDKVRRELGDYLDFEDTFFLDCRELNAKASKGASVYFPVEKAFREKYADFLHNMLVNRFTLTSLRPEAVVQWTSEHNDYLGCAIRSAKLMFAQTPESPDVVAYYLSVKSLIGNRENIAWAKTFAQHVNVIKADKSHPNHKENWFKILCALGHFQLREGDYEESQTAYKTGITHLEEAIGLGVATARELGELHTKMGLYLLLNLDEVQAAETHLSKAIELLEAHGTKADDMGFIGDPLLSYAYFYRGEARDGLPKKSRPKDTVISDDFVKFCALNDSEDSYRGAYQVAYLSSEDKSRVDEQYQHAMQYINAIEPIEADFPARGNVMSLTVINLLAHGDKSRAEGLYEALKKDFPKHEDRKVIDKMLKKFGKRKKLFGIL